MSVFEAVSNESAYSFDARVAPLPSLIFRLPATRSCAVPPLSIWIDAMIMLFPACNEVGKEAIVVSVVSIATDEPSV